MSHAEQGHPRCERGHPTHSEEFCQNVVHWRTKWQTMPVSLPQEHHGQHEKEKDMILKGEPHPHLRSEGVQ